MARDLQSEMEQRFDPTDANAAMDLAYESLRAMRLMARAIRAHDDGVRLGRDLSTEMNASLIVLGVRLGLLEYQPRGADTDALFRDLLGRAKK